MGRATRSVARVVALAGVALAGGLGLGCAGPRSSGTNETRAPSTGPPGLTTLPGAGAAGSASAPAVGDPVPSPPVRAVTPPPGGWTVRRTTVVLDDPSRPTPARGSIPAHAGRQLRTTVRWPVAADGAVVAGRLPLVVFAHGYLAAAATYATLLDDLAAGGLVVAAPELPGESSALPGPGVESDIDREPCDIAFVGAALERDPPPGLRATLPGAPLVVAGHSDGATAAAATAYASTCATVPVRAVVALSANDVSMAAARRLGPAAVLLAVTGGADEVNPPSHTAALYRHAPPPAWLATVEGGNHLSTFTTDPDVGRLGALIAAFVVMVVDRDPDAAHRFTAAAGGRIHLQSR